MAMVLAAASVAVIGGRAATPVPVRNPSSIPQNNFRPSSYNGDIGSLSLQRSAPWIHDEVIAEFSPRDQLALQQAMASLPNQNRPSARPVSTQNPLLPRLKVNPRQSMSRNWRSMMPSLSLHASALPNPPLVHVCHHPRTTRLGIARLMPTSRG